MDGAVRPFSGKEFVILIRHDRFIQLPTFIIGIIGLQRGLFVPSLVLIKPIPILKRSTDSPRIYPLLLAYSSAALVTTITLLVITLAAPSSDNANQELDPISQFYSMTEEGRRSILGPLIPFLIVPAIMWVDMIIRLAGLVNDGITMRERKNVGKSTTTGDRERKMREEL